jgi:hypothetical protein
MKVALPLPLPLPQADYQEVTYEAYGPGGTGFIVECLTDNLNRLVWAGVQLKPSALMYTVFCCRIWCAWCGGAR